MAVTESVFSLYGWKYFEAGYSVLPVQPGTKIPGQFNFQHGCWSGLPSWTRFCTTHPTVDDIELWCTYPGAGISVACGSASGIVAVDYDSRSELHGSIESVLPQSPVRKTGARGHTAFYRFNGEISKTWKLPDPIGGASECVIEILSTGRHTILPPTVHPSSCGYRYLTCDALLDINPSDLPVLPANVHELITAALQSFNTTSRAPFSKLPANPNTREAQEAKVKTALSYIPADDYDTWLDVGMALHSDDPSERGRDLWAEWSRGSSRFGGISQIGEKWCSFSSVTKVTLGTLFYLAKQHGWSGSGSDSEAQSESYRELKAQIAVINDEDTLTSGILRRVFQGGFTSVQQEKLLELIKSKTGASLGALKADGRRYAEEARVSDLDIARQVCLRFGRGNLLSVTGRGIWHWKSTGVWQPIDDRKIKAVIHEIGEGQIEITRNSADSVLDLIKTETASDGDVFDCDISTINCLNGELHLNDDGWTLRPHRRESYRTTQIPIVYDPTAKAPRFEQFIREIFAGDADAEQKQASLLEMMGYTIIASCRFERFALLYGNGQNGKSVVLTIVRELCGTKNVSAVNPHSLNNRFQRAHMAGKLANIVTEIAEGAELADAELKATVSGELMTAEHKHKPPFEFTPFCTCWFGTNHMPHTRDYSDALQRRAIIYTFNRKFSGDQCDVMLVDKLKAELPGILAIVLSHLNNAIRRGGILEPDSSKEAKGKWQTESDQVRQFVDDECSLGADLSENSQVLYIAYRVWGESAGIRRLLNRRNFLDRLRALGVQAGRTNKERLQKGIALKRVSST